MIKASAKLGDGRTLIVLGLSEANLRELRRDRPIMFSLSELGVADLSPGRVVVTYQQADGRAAFPKGFVQADGFSIVLGSLAIKALRSGPLEMDGPESLKFLLFSGKDEAAMEEEFRGLIGPETRVTRLGYAPADVPPGRNYGDK